MWVVSNRTWPALFRRSAGHGLMRNCVGRFFLKVAGRPELPVWTRSGLPRTAAFHDLNVTQRSVAARMRRATSRLHYRNLRDRVGQIPRRNGSAGLLFGNTSSSPGFPVGLPLEKLRAAFRVVQDRLEAGIATQWQEGRASSDVDERDACGLAHQFRQTGQRFVLAAGHRAA
jgi:hypothetical protein